MAIKIGINGFGRIGRGFVRALAHAPQTFDLALINDLTDADMLAHLLNYDSVHGRFELPVHTRPNGLVIGDDPVTVTSVRNPAEIPWKEYGVDIVIEATGRFRAREDAQLHLTAGAKKVIITAPAKSPDITLACGINLDKYDPKAHNIISNASCTTNCLAPVAKVLDETFGIESGIMTTVHSYTNDQRILDLPHKDKRRARAAAMSMIPTTTGAAKALKEVLPHLEGKIGGSAIRVPTPNVSLVDLTIQSKKAVTVTEVNEAFMRAEQGALAGVLATSDEPLVSCDYNGNRFSSTIDLDQTSVNGKLIRVLSWYDNESGYSQRVFDLAKFLGATL